MKRQFAVACAACALYSLAAAEGGPPSAPEISGTQSNIAADGAKDAAPHQDDAGRLIMFARQLRDEKGCAAAAPALRVISGMGEGQEAAQHELGECLLTLKGGSEIETSLFRKEGEFWLTRAAFAGNARAQRKLAMEMASPASPLHDPKGSLQWALIYAKNPTADLYGYGPLPATMAPGLRSSLSAVEIKDAESFASGYAPVTLAKFEAPKRDRKGGAFSGDQVRPHGDKRRRPGIAQ